MLRSRLLITMLLFGSLAWSQAKVEGRAFQGLLNTLLSHSVPEISVDSLGTILNEVQLLDARKFEEYQVSHLKGARHVGYDEFAVETLRGLDKNKCTVVYCSIGYRSEKIAEKLLALGFKNVHNLYGGLFEWVNQDQEVLDKNEAPTSKVHAYSRSWGVWLDADVEKEY